MDIAVHAINRLFSPSPVPANLLVLYGDRGGMTWTDNWICGQCSASMAIDIVFIGECYLVFIIPLHAARRAMAAAPTLPTAGFYRISMSCPRPT